MSTIRTVVEKLEEFIKELNEIEVDASDCTLVYADSIANDLQQILKLLTDKTVLLLEWNERDIQRVARERIAHIEDVEDCEIVENPLPREDVEIVISVLEKQYDCNYGITWEHIACAMDYIQLPSLSECKIKKKEKIKFTRKEYEQYLNELVISSDEYKSNGGRVPDNAKYGTWLRKHDPIAFNAGYNDERRERCGCL